MMNAEEPAAELRRNAQQLLRQPTLALSTTAMTVSAVIPPGSSAMAIASSSAPP